MQHAVDPVADDQSILERLDVNVRRALLERVGDDQADETDDRRFGGEVLQLLDVGEHPVFVDDACLDAIDDLSQRRLVAAVKSLQRLVELVGQRDHRSDRPAGHHLECFDGELVGGVDHGQHQLVLVLADRDRARLAEETRADALLENREFGIGVGLDHRDAELQCKRFGHFALRDQAEIHQQLAQTLAFGTRTALGIRLLQPKRAIERDRIELATLDEHLAHSPADRRGLCGDGRDNRRGRIGRHRCRVVRHRDHGRSVSASDVVRQRQRGLGGTRGRCRMGGFQHSMSLVSRRVYTDARRYAPVRRWLCCRSHSSPVKAAFAAAIVASTSASLCAPETNPASNADGAR